MCSASGSAFTDVRRSPVRTSRGSSPFQGSRPTGAIKKAALSAALIWYTISRRFQATSAAFEKSGLRLWGIGCMCSASGSAFTDVHRSPGRTSRGSSPFQGSRPTGAIKKAALSAAFYWYTIRGSNPGHPARQKSFFRVLYGVIACYICCLYPCHCNRFRRQ